MTVPTRTQEAHGPAGTPDDAADSARLRPEDVTVRRLASLDEYTEACTIQEETWGVGFSERVPAAILNVAQRVGGVTAGAFSRDGRMLGFVFGMTGVRDGRLAHWSDMLAVREEARGGHLGDRLKHFQRECCLEVGVETMLWTFDPLVARNAHINVNRLGARAAEYVPNMYGSNTGSALHGALATDRLIAEWDLRDARRSHGHLAASARPAATSLVVLDGRGIPSFHDAGAAPTVLVDIPRDSHALRLENEPAIYAWREASRTAFLTYFARGYHVTGFWRGEESGANPGYVMERVAST